MQEVYEAGKQPLALITSSWPGKKAGSGNMHS